MIDPTKITKFDCSTAELEELILFWVCAAGKNGLTAARCLDSLLTDWLGSVKCIKAAPTPFDIVRFIAHKTDLAEQMRKHGIGCYRAKAKTFKALAYSNLDLHTCTVEDLETIPGIGPKTARCFLIHSRPNQQYAGLDTHILKFLADKGYKVPSSTPTGRKYRELETVFLELAAKAGKAVADFDLEIWNRYRAVKRSA